MQKYTKNIQLSTHIPQRTSIVLLKTLRETAAPCVPLVSLVRGLSGNPWCALGDVLGTLMSNRNSNKKYNIRSNKRSYEQK